MKYFFAPLFLFFGLFSFSQQTEYVDFKSAKADIIFGDLSKKEVEGLVTYEFEILKSVDSVFIDAKGFDRISYKLNGQFEDSLYNGQQLIVKHPFKANTTHKLDVMWKTSPKKALYFIDWDTSTALSVTNGNKQIWTQGQGKYTSNWLPSIDDMNDKIEFDLNIVFPEGDEVYNGNQLFEVIANGKLKKKTRSSNLTEWHFDMQKPMSSYLVALAIGKYAKKVEYSKSGIPLEMYYYPEDSLKFEPTYRYTKHMFDFLEEEIGVPYPWQNYKQVPVKDFLYAGMENTSATIFSDAFVVDSIAFVDKNYVNVNAHELAHQWFGNLVTETSGTHHWLQEGFATYYALLAEKEVFGDDYYYWRLYEYAQELLAQDKAGGSTSLLDPKSSSTTFYKKGAWVLHILREKVGDEAFRKAVKSYLEKHQFKNVETDDFIREVEKASGQDLKGFVKVWLEDDVLLYEKMETELEKSSKYVEAYLNVNCDADCDELLRETKNEKLKIKIITQSPLTIYNGLKCSENLKIRQAIAQNLSKIPSELKADYETLLDDKSYITIETALINLWQNFPHERIKYLNKTKGIQGFNDKNIRILWLTLALITEDFEPENKSQYFEELTNYTSDVYGFETRINAFRYLTQIQACNDACKENLQQATTHHSWQFSKFAKELLEDIKN